MRKTSKHWFNPVMRISNTRWVLLAAAVVFILIFTIVRITGDSKSTEAAKAPPGIAVDTALASRSDVPVYLDGLGTVQAFYTVTITPRVDGELQKVGFIEGQTVKTGDLIAQIDARPYQAALDQAVATRDKDAAQFANAEHDLQRYDTLAPQNFTSKQTVDTQRALVAQLKAQVQGDKAAIDNARTQLDYTTINSPIDGLTGIRQVDPGNNVHAAATTGIVVITQMQPISVIFTLPEEALLGVSKAMTAGPTAVTAMSRDGKTELDQGTISLIDNQIDQSTGTIRLKAIFSNIGNKLWPGEFVNIRVLEETRHDALTIPTAAVQRGPNGVYAYVVKSDSTVEIRSMETTDDTGTVTVVTGGLQEGERVTTSNAYRLQQGVHVTLDKGAATTSKDAPKASTS